MIKLHRKGWQRLWVVGAVVSLVVFGVFFGIIIAEHWRHPSDFVLNDIALFWQNKCSDKPPPQGIFDLPYLSKHKCPYLFGVRARLERGGYSLNESGYRAYIQDPNKRDLFIAMGAWAAFAAALYVVPWGLLTVGRWVGRGFKGDYHSKQHRPKEHRHKQYWR